MIYSGNSKPGKIDGSPVIAGDKVFIGSGDGRIYMLDLKSGEELWNYEIGSSISVSPAIIDGMLIIAASDGRIYAFGI